MNYFFHKAAEIELKEAADYYEKQQPKLGLQFVAEIYLTIQRVVAHPEAWPRMGADVRRAIVHRFPYGVLYTVMQEQIFILAIMHLHREPGYWQGRS